MQSVKRYLPIVVLLLSANIGLSQHTPLSAGFVLGGSNYLGEIGGKFEPRASLLDADIITTSPTVGGFLRYAANDRVRISGEVNYVQIRQADQNAEDPARQARNLNFRNRMVEFGFRTDFTVFHIADRSNNRNFSKPASSSSRAMSSRVLTAFYTTPRLRSPMIQITNGKIGGTTSVRFAPRGRLKNTLR